MLYCPLSLSQDQEAHCKARYDQVRADGEKIHELVRENMQHFQVSIQSIVGLPSHYWNTEQQWNLSELMSHFIAA